MTITGRIQKIFHRNLCRRKITGNDRINSWKSIDKYQLWSRHWKAEIKICWNSSDRTFYHLVGIHIIADMKQTRPPKFFAILYQTFVIRERSEDQEFHWRDEEQNQNHQHRRVADVTVKQHTHEAELLSEKFSVKNYFNEQLNLITAQSISVPSTPQGIRSWTEKNRQRWHGSWRRLSKAYDASHCKPSSLKLPATTEEQTDDPKLSSKSTKLEFRVNSLRNRQTLISWWWKDFSRSCRWKM